MSTVIDAITIPTREELVSRARALQPLLREHAATGDTERKASDAAIDAVTAAGFFRLLSPRQKQQGTRSSYVGEEVYLSWHASSALVLTQ